MSPASRSSNPFAATILVAEDSATQAEKLRHLLEKEGHQVLVAGNGQQALDLARRRRPTLVISDVVMPVMDGYALCKAIKSDETLKETPIILVTTLVDPLDVIRGLECGASNFLRKPYDERQLLSRVDYLLMNANLRRGQKVRAGVEISLRGRTHFIAADRQQILDLLISSFEEAVEINAELKKTQAAIERANRELHEREFEARAANQTKSVFLATMSHEIRTPLVGVLGMLDVLGHSKLDAEQRRQFNIVRHSARHLLEIVGDILDYSKIEAGKMQLAAETLSIRDSVSRVVSMFRASAESRGLRLTQDVADAVARAHRGDSVRIRQILANFVSNAIKFTERGGSVTVAVGCAPPEAGAQRLTFSVADTGVGMTPAVVDQIFQPFVQFGRSATHRIGGTGLGLAISRRLADLMGGTVSVQSRPGQGTSVILELCLPLGDPRAIVAEAAEEAAPVPTRPKPTREQAQREGTLLLLAEDHPINRAVLTQQLDLAGFVTDTAESGPLALEKFRSGAYGLVLTDLHMPGLDGFQLAAAIRQFERERGWGRRPIIAVTADVVPEDVERCFVSGMDDYLAKPVTIRQLSEKLRAWLPDLDWGAAESGVAPLRAPSPEPSGGGAPVDPAVLAQFTRGNAGKARDLLRSYCRSVTEDLGALDEAQRQGGAAVAGVAHRIKGAAQMIGAHEVAALAERIERLTCASSSADVTGLVDGLRQALAAVEAHVRSLPGGAP